MNKKYTYTDSKFDFREVIPKLGLLYSFLTLVITMVTQNEKEHSLDKNPVRKEIYKSSADAPLKKETFDYISRKFPIKRPKKREK
ncbi:hypothetical protein [Flavobacterium sp. U410]|jgi:hypothetical protein